MVPGHRTKTNTRAVGALRICRKRWWPKDGLEAMPLILYGSHGLFACYEREVFQCII